ncbi:amidohydrolase [Biformimicrobium ophioploci]|uniref:Amidohydrolase n=1 Tax=Biformimicrobium ophioploci TaxID=3036711 RepID=A0ABQ6LYI9_9GAMM|nr:amidohydrolase [Microbulbifer sp. NKW57]GMG87163.1 amidohydrolase [Microbulbifer sp. NKW57]
MLKTGMHWCGAGGLLLLLLVCAGCSRTDDAREPQALRAGQGDTAAAGVEAEVIFFGGEILTMEGERPQYVNAVAIAEGRILFAGDRKGALALRGEGTQMRNLRGRAMLPGFIDAHSHFMFALAMVNQVNIASPPVGKATDIASVISALKAFKAERGLADEDWIVGWGYDPDGLKEKRHITIEDLDPYFPDNKVMLIHVSGHGAVLNSRALEWAGIGENTAAPEGGVIARMPGGTRPAGLVMETAYLPILAKQPKPSEQELLELMDEAQAVYTRNGYTHAQEGFSHIQEMDLLLKAAEQQRLLIDIVSLPNFTEYESWKGKYTFGVYRNRLKFEGIKFTQDGSPQGKTAYVSEPYLTEGPAGEQAWRGKPTQPEADFISQVQQALADGLHVFVHANGDATIDAVIEAVSGAGITAADDRRTIVVHSQFQRPEQLDRYVELGLSPSYFTNHTFFWGEVHLKNIGRDRARFISPVRAAVDQGLVFSNHTDFNVTPLDPFFVMWTAMARQMRNGKVLGADQRVDAYTALQGLTTGPAWQVFEENRKGRIRAGLLADFVILSFNPATASAKNIRNIRVLETIKEGRTVYKAEL